MSRCSPSHQVSLDCSRCSSAFRFGPILSGCTRHRCSFSASILANFSWHTEQRKGALTTSRADLSLHLPTPQKTIILSSRMQATTCRHRHAQPTGTGASMSRVTGRCPVPGIATCHPSGNQATFRHHPSYIQATADLSTCQASACPTGHQGEIKCKYFQPILSYARNI